MCEEWTECTPTEYGDFPRPARCEPCQEQAERNRIVAPAAASIPEFFRDAKLSSPMMAKWSPKWAQVRAQILGLHAFDGPIVFYGQGGRGKTTCACAYLRDIIDRGRVKGCSLKDRERARKSFLVDEMALALDRQQSRLGTGEAPLVARAESSSVLVIDDFGQGKGMGDSTVGDIIATRHASRRQTVITTALSAGEIEAAYGGRTKRRIFENAEVICL